MLVAYIWCLVGHDNLIQTLSPKSHRHYGCALNGWLVAIGEWLIDMSGLAFGDGPHDSNSSQDHTISSISLGPIVLSVQYAHTYKSWYKFSKIFWSL